MIRDMIIRQAVDYLTPVVLAAAVAFIGAAIRWVFARLKVENKELESKLNDKLSKLATSGLTFAFEQAKKDPRILTQPGRIVDIAKQYMREQAPDDLPKINDLTKYVEARKPAVEAAIKPVTNVAQPPPQI